MKISTALEKIDEHQLFVAAFQGSGRYQVAHLLRTQAVSTRTSSEANGQDTTP